MSHWVTSLSSHLTENMKNPYWLKDGWPQSSHNTKSSPSMDDGSHRHRTEAPSLVFHSLSILDSP